MKEYVICLPDTYITRKLIASQVDNNYASNDSKVFILLVMTSTINSTIQENTYSGKQQKYSVY